MGCLIVLIVPDPTFSDLKDDAFAILFFMVALVVSLIIGNILGKIKAKVEIKKNEKSIVKNNEIIYFRELPNNYGVGVNSLLMDSKMENKKDIVAIILDLCARGYLNLTKTANVYQLTVLKDDYTTLLKNEMYILDAVIHHEVDKINYNTWFKYCLDDGRKLGIFDDLKKKESNNLTKSSNKESKHFSSKIIKEISFIIITLITLIIGILVIFLLPKTILPHIAKFMPIFIITFGVMYESFIDVAKFHSEISYSHTLYDYVRPSKQGIIAKQKLLSFKSFLEDFGNFAEKSPEEITLWEFYLSYAQMFGLTDKILATGYDKLIHNASFHIENMDEINLNDVDVVLEDKK